MSKNNFDELTVDDAICEDRANLFALADEVIAAAPVRGWDLWVADANKAHFLTQFLSDVVAQSPSQIEVPSIVHIANSRSVQKSPEHQEVIARRLARTGITGNALILSEYTSSWRTIASLDGHLRQAGAAAVDVAILNVGESNPYAPMPTYKPDNLYFGQKDANEPGLCLEIVGAANPHITVVGYAEPQPDPDADLALYDQASAAYRDLAQEYTLLHS